METETSLGTATAGPGQYISHFPIRIGGYVKVVLRRAPVHWRGTEGPIPISLIVLKGYRYNLYH
jgi:hypothetical protein